MEQNILVAESNDVERAQFFRKTYLHVALAVLAFIGVEIVLFNVVPEEIIASMLGMRYLWLLLIGAFWLCSILANKWAMSLNKNTQYMGLGLYVIIEAIIFLPLLYVAIVYSGGNVVFQAAMLTLAMFAGLSGVALSTKRDFSFLRTFIVVGGFLALGTIVAGIVFGFNLGLWFSVAMVILASASILYETNKLKDSFGTQQYVGAALQLFASVMLLFWYILRILMSRRD